MSPQCCGQSLVTGHWSLVTGHWRVVTVTVTVTVTGKEVIVVLLPLCCRKKPEEENLTVKAYCYPRNQSILTFNLLYTTEILGNHLSNSLLIYRQKKSNFVVFTKDDLISSAIGNDFSSLFKGQNLRP